MRSLLLACLVVAPLALAEAPLSLTASDGSGLALVSLTARGVVEDPLAFTELTLTFENPQDRVIEGQFRITLPRGAAVSRFAMKQDQVWQEGEVVERQAARRAYEDFLHRRQDPALLEQGAANEFTARVFPIPARGRKELVLSYSQELAGVDATYVLMLKGLPKVGSLDAAVFDRGAAPITLKKEGFVPDRDLVVKPSRANRAGLRSGEQLVLRVRPVAQGLPEPLDSVTFLVDSSASRALGFAAQVSLVEKLLAQLRPTAQVTIAAFDQQTAVVAQGTAGELAAQGLKKLKDRRALGASNVEAALAFAGTTGRSRVVLVSDGVATAGATGQDLLLAAVKKLKAAGVQRLDAIAVGGIRDEAALRGWVTAGLPRDGAVLDGDQEPATLFRRLSEGTRSKVAVALQGASFVWPTQLDGVQQGDEVLVYAELPATAPVKLSLSGQPAELPGAVATADAAPLVARAVAQAKIASLVDQMDRRADGPKEKEALKAKAITLSVQHRVLSPFTALLVLETEADYARFHIDRRALADILTVNDGRVRLTHRTAPSLASPPPPMAKVVDPSRSKRAETGRAERAPAGRGETTTFSEDGDARSKDQVEDGEAEKKEVAESGAARPPPPSEAPRPAAAAPSVERRVPAPARAGLASAADSAPPARAEERRRARPPTEPTSMADAAEPMQVSRDPYDGPFKKVMEALRGGKKEQALAEAFGWREEQPGDVLALVALGEALEAQGELPRAARAYGSIIDLFPSRADLRRFAGVRLERLKDAAALELAADTFAKAAEQRPDHPASHRLLAFALVRAGQPEKALAALEKGLSQRYPTGRFAGVDRILREDLGLVAAAWAKAEPSRRGAIEDRARRAGGTLEREPSLRFVLNWETDANDVDFHILDAKGGHAYYGAMALPSGGNLYADVTTGYGPECFTIRLPPGKRAYPYRLRAHYYSRGPMGYGMGKLEIVEHDGAGGLKFTERPYVVMVDGAFVDLGTVER